MHNDNSLTIDARHAMLWQTIDQTRYAFHHFFQQQTVGYLWWKKPLIHYANEHHWEIVTIKNQVDTSNQSWFWWWDRLFSDIHHKEQWVTYQTCKLHLTAVLPALTHDAVPDPLDITTDAFTQIKSLTRAQLAALQHHFTLPFRASALQPILTRLTTLIQNLWQLITPTNTPHEGSTNMVISIYSPALRQSTPTAPVAHDQKAPSQQLITTSKEYANAYVLYANLCTFLNLKIGIASPQDIKNQMDALQKNIAEAKMHSAEYENTAIDFIIENYLTLAHSTPQWQLLSQSTAAPVPMTEALKFACTRKTDIENREKVVAFLDNGQKTRIKKEELRKTGITLPLSEAYLLSEYCGMLGIDTHLLDDPLTEQTINHYYRLLSLKLHPDITRNGEADLPSDIHHSLKHLYTESIKMLGSVHQFHKSLFHKKRALLIPLYTFSAEEKRFVLTCFEHGQHHIKLKLLLVEILKQRGVISKLYKTYCDKAKKITDSLPSAAEEDLYLFELETFEEQTLLPAEHKLQTLNLQHHEMMNAAMRITAYRESYLKKHPNLLLLITLDHKILSLPAPEKKADHVPTIQAEHEITDEKSSVNHAFTPNTFNADRISVKEIRTICVLKRELAALGNKTGQALLDHKGSDMYQKIVAEQKATIYTAILNNFSALLVKLTLPELAKTMIADHIKGLKRTLTSQHDFPSEEFHKLYQIMCEQNALADKQTLPPVKELLNATSTPQTQPIAAIASTPSGHVAPDDQLDTKNTSKTAMPTNSS